MSTKPKSVPCDKHGRPLLPKDIDPRKAFARAAILLAAGVLLVPTGILLFTLVPLGEDAGVVKLAFGMLIFFGALFLLFGGTVAIMATAQKRRLPSEAERIRSAIEDGEVCEATVTAVRTRRRKTAGGVVSESRLFLEYADPRYRFTRKFTSDWAETPFGAGDTVPVYYHPDSNLGYFVDTRGEGK